MQRRLYIKLWQRQKRDREAMTPSEGKLQCLICNRWYRQVGTHVWQTHGCTMADYKLEFGLDQGRGILPDDLKEIKKNHVFENGTVKNLKKGKKFWFKKGDKSLGRYERSKQTLDRLKNLYKLRYIK